MTRDRGLPVGIDPGERMGRARDAKNCLTRPPVGPEKVVELCNRWRGNRAGRARPGRAKVNRQSYLHTHALTGAHRAIGLAQSSRPAWTSESDEQTPIRMNEDTSTTLRPNALEVGGGTGQQFPLLLGVVKAILVLNLLDAIFTLWWVGVGVAVEANTLLRDLVTDNPLGFVLAKLGLVSLGSVLLWRQRQHPLAVFAIFGAFALYYLILLYHLHYSSLFYLP